MRWLVVFVTHRGHALMSEIKDGWTAADAFELCLAQYGRPRNVIYAQAMPWPIGATMDEAVVFWLQEYGNKLVIGAWDRLKIA